ncbi:MAG TPA: DUF92 domain-containing protein, partial [Candidatus Micrarchaeota archaeon]|nr:DUF92 domain-containing protein [Candidatus Micrarchaeota archaeon]
MKAALLDFRGTALAAIFGIAMLAFGGWEALLLMLIFLIASVIVTKHGYEEKRELGIYEHERSWENVLANGIVPVICAYLSPSIGIWPMIGSIAAITADKFASELGVLSSTPISILNLKQVKRGVSGAITPFGTLMSFDGALLIGVAVFVIYGLVDPWKVLLVGIIGFTGSLVDSIFG